MATAIKRSQLEREMVEAFGLVPEWSRGIPDVALAGIWSTMHDFQLAETALSNKTKELIGLAVSGATRCRYCQLFHLEAARVFGATDAEIAEACAMGAATMSVSTYLNAAGVDYEQFKKETLKIVSHVRAQLAGSPQLASSPKPENRPRV